MLGFLTPYHIRLLTDNPWEGGGGYTPAQVGDLTLDQAYMRLTNRKYLRSKVGGHRTDTKPVIAFQPGPVRGRTPDGKPITGFIGKQSVAARVAAEAAAKRRAPIRKL